MSHLSLPLSQLQAHYGCVVVGSGYGGSVAASRLARAGQSVALLERGREIAPGRFPDTPVEAAAQLQVRGLPGRHGDPRALFDLLIDVDISALRGCGLGGSSLINAGVALRPAREVYDDPAWPAAIREDLDAGLEEGFRRAEAMLRPAPYPEGKPGYPALPKLRAMETAAKALGGTFSRPPMNVHFGPAGTNHVGEPVSPCVGCGDCCSGCNFRAKNTTAMTWLPDARNHGAQLFCEVEVAYLERRTRGWRVHLRPLGDAAPPRAFVDADRVVLAAGSLGSPEILLRSREHGLPLSPALGTRFTGNGDTLGFGYNCDVPIATIGRGPAKDELLPAGPCIGGLITLRRDGRTLYIEDGTAPSAVGGLRAAVLAAASRVVGHDTDWGLRDEAAEHAREADTLVRGPHFGASLHTQTWLGVSRDDAGGTLRLEHNHLRIHWPGVGDQPAYAAMVDAMHQATAALGGTWIPNPLWHSLQQKPLMTTHPLGGCPMGEHGKSGVVDHAGRVFSGAGDALHAELYVLDGSVLPCSPGCNPLLIISALAERAMTLLIAREGWTERTDSGVP